MRRILAIAAALVAIAGCIRVIINVGGRDVDQQQAVDIEPTLGIGNPREKGKPEGGAP